MSKTIPPAPRRYGSINGLGLATLMEREIMRFMKVAAQTLVAPLVSTILFMMVFTLALGRTASPLAGVSYPEFLGPGLIMMAVLSNAFQNSSSSLVIAKVQGNAVDFLMPPLSATELAIAFIGGAAARGLLVGFVGSLALLPFADLRPAHIEAVIYFALLAGVMFGAIGLIGGIWAEKFDHIAAVTNFVVTPLTFLSGTFYSIERLPGPLAEFAHWNPVFLLIDGFRYGFVGVADGDVAFGAIVALLVTAALCFWAWALLKSGYRLRA